MNYQAREIMKSVKAFEIAKWDLNPEKDVQTSAIEHLEGGNVLFFPMLPFHLTDQEKAFLTPSIGDPKKKNISYNIQKDALSGTLLNEEERRPLKGMIRRFAEQSTSFLEKLIPHYKKDLIWGKTSFRPFEISGRTVASNRKDDTLLHVDSFPSNPTGGTRILRIFTNINHENKPRIWKTGEPFEAVAEKMLSRVGAPIPGYSQLLNLLGITKSLRTSYDHYMLQIHNAMKKDQHYQNTVSQEEVIFPPGTSWMVFTDQVSHAALKGQHVLEQTYHIPVTSLQNEATAPLRVLERRLKKRLI
jgi:hypothetical protein